ncbi:guanine nucleotide exchange protein for ADP-robosylation factor, partial [Blyttiomyces sp. JEL0837]
MNSTSSDVFIKMALDQLLNAKETKRLPQLRDSCKSALVAIDCLGKLFTYNYWSRTNMGDTNWDDATGGGEFEDSIGSGGGHGGGSGSSTPSAFSGMTTPSGRYSMRSNQSSMDEERASFEESGSPTAGGGGGVIGQVVGTICDTFSGGENTDEKLQVQIVKALLSTVSCVDPIATIHGGVLLKAIRTTYNIFLLSRSANTQVLAQTTLTQMVQAVFGRISKEVCLPSPTNISPTLPDVKEVEAGDSANKVTSDGGNGSPGNILRGTNSQESFNSANGIDDKRADSIIDSKKGKKDPLTQQVKDCFLVFRALCKLSMKPIPAPEGATDLKSHAMRSKLLSLHLVHTILSSHSHIFYIPAPILLPMGSTATSTQFIHSKELSVIFTEIIIPIMEARSSITFNQRNSLLKSLSRILGDNADGGRLLVEIYLNYDCDLEATARENIWERLITSLCKVLSTHDTHHGGAAGGGTGSGQVSPHRPGTEAGSAHSGSMPPNLTTATLTSFTKEQVKELYSVTGDFADLKKKGLELLVKGILKSLVLWCDEKMSAQQTAPSPTDSEMSPDKDKETSLGLVKDGEGGETAEGGLAPPPVPLMRPTSAKSMDQDDPRAFQNLKNRKQAMLEGIKRFNTKPKKGIQYLLDTGCIPSRTPQDIASFLHNTDGLNKTMIGEFLGEGDEENITIMHAFVDELDFAAMPFVTALRTFLQSFRLPGESQKIDRFMLKFAERYLQNNPKAFSTADTAYVLAYSVIMLNTDQHNSQVKKRMTKADFLKNNRGIDEGKDLPPAILEAVFDEIVSNEIVMKEEQALKTTAAGGAPGVTVSISNDRKKDATQFAIASETMAMKTEALFNSIMRAGRKNQSGTGTPSPNPSIGAATSPGGTQFYSANHYEHVKPMFQIIWMSILTALSGPLQESDDPETMATALEGFKYAAKIACLFDIDLEKKAFLSTLARFTQLANISEVKPKNVQAIKTLVEIGLGSGNIIGESWLDVVIAVSQLEKIQQLSADINNQRAVMEAKSSKRDPNVKVSKTINEEAAALASSQTMTLTVDRLFTSSAKLSGVAIVEFVRALCQVSWEEITSSVASAEHPRMYCLQRLVEISYYNMNRIRVEWSNLWAILGEHFNQVGCHSNTQVCFFALDKLRQLAMKFLELEELPNFKFQKDFLKPFEHILANNPDPKIKDMALACLQQMSQAKAKSMKSGWKAMFGAFLKAAREPHEQILLLAFDIVKSIFKNNFENVVANLTFADFISCVVEFCKNKKFTKTSLQAIELLKQTIPRIFDMSKTTTGSRILQATAAAVEKSTTEMLAGTPVGALLAKNSDKYPGATPITATSALPSLMELSTPVGGPGFTTEETLFRFWFPILYGLYEVIMTCELEVRTRALTYLFDTLKTHGSGFTRDSWEVIAKGVLFPIFDDLRLSQQEHTKFANKEDLSVWLNTTLIQALRQFVDLYGHYLEELLFCADGLLELLTVCMTQENETLARIGATCLQQFIESNVDRLDDDVWDKTCNMFTHIFKVTTPDALFFDYRTQEPAPPSTIIAPPETDDMPFDATDAGGITNATSPSDEISGQVTNKSSEMIPARTSVTAAPATNLDRVVPDITGRPKPEKKDFQGIISKCVLHLLVIQTLQDILGSDQNDKVYNSLQSRHVFILIDCLERSYRFAKAFNEDMELRM